MAKSKSKFQATVVFPVYINEQSFYSKKEFEEFKKLSEEEQKERLFDMAGNSLEADTISPRIAFSTNKKLKDQF